MVTSARKPIFYHFVTKIVPKSPLSVDIPSKNRKNPQKSSKISQIHQNSENPENLGIWEIFEDFCGFFSNFRGNIDRERRFWYDFGNKMIKK